MAKASIIAARQAQATESVAALLADVIERLERIERMLVEAKVEKPKAKGEAGK